MVSNLYDAPVNNFGLDPLQGYDFETWCQDTSSGKIAWFGKFQSLTLSVRNATETYLELGQRVPIYLDGEIQIAWVLEQGLVDMAFIERTFGTDTITRDSQLTRGPRFQITFDALATRLIIDDASLGQRSNDQINRLGAASILPARVNASKLGTIPANRAASGRYELQRCKPDSVSLGIMPGRRVAAVRWEGVAEGIRYIPNQTVQQAKSNTTTSSENNTTGVVNNAAGR
ncbi:hypothetical protein H6G33_09335 [Calothrix sp. FACHB-1219]|uniref:hypothetical protein n=1 Tax=unclassified Calothrix TaxID=2619626 RepID=UPI0016883067|nr:MULTISPECIES: hypothetical protein [unclassified Calothrix]MBD2201548.1 hypothetical protein [Calothrix sp. FACHB-168]MBD2217234.1 hypothetical protein [Calothrix sp. FACHB-1219]